jgi:hypothetical protein
LTCSDATTCLTCQDGYWGTTTCTKCTTNVATCSAAAVHVTCAAGYCLGNDGTNDTCYKCPLNCLSTAGAALTPP